MIENNSNLQVLARCPLALRLGLLITGLLSLIILILILSINDFILLFMFFAIFLLFFIMLLVFNIKTPKIVIEIDGKDFIIHKSKKKVERIAPFEISEITYSYARFQHMVCRHGSLHYHLNDGRKINIPFVGEIDYVVETIRKMYPMIEVRHFRFFRK